MIYKNIKQRLNTSILLLILVFLIFNFNQILLFTLLVLGVISFLEFLNISRKIFKNKLNLIFSNLLFIIYISIYCFLFFFFSNFPQLKILLFALLCTCIGSDIGGFIFGKIFKGRKLTKISPNKTLSGSVGSFLFSILIFSSFIFYFTNNFSYTFLIISLITSLTCQLGDLFFSFLKRKAKVKDTGNFLPGHGGVLDRLDGIFLGIPLGFCAFILFI
jgi:phosphatidate cytidylyltransferase|tara:strand:- start:66 stop:716 length:651 start_codon:yes stop_codon:yes gene_type:complete